MNFASKTEAGIKGFNQDALVIPAKENDSKTYGHCFAVSDGITLCPKGGDLAQYSMKIVALYYQHALKEGAGEKALDLALDQLWNDFFEKAERENDDDSLVSGATLTIALVLNGKLHIRHMGDSTCDLFLPDGSALRLTDEHSTPDGCLVNYFGGEMKTPPQADTFDFPQGSKLLLSSDGISYFLDAEAMQKIGERLDWNGDDMIKEMFAISAQAGSTDDCTILFGY
jgi:serine/threonine protein phosphatase PrpC